MVVPESPKTPGGSPAFWFGVQTEKGDGALVQPIMAKELGYRPGSGSSFYMFQGKHLRGLATDPETQAQFHGKQCDDVLRGWLRCTATRIACTVAVAQIRGLVGFVLHRRDLRLDWRKRHADETL